MRVAGGWLDGATQRPSPNQDARPDPADVSLLVIHGISLPPGEFGGPWIDALFANRLDLAAHPYFTQLAGLAVSAHVLIRRDGEVVQYVPFDARAWHAGASCFAGRERCNDYSIGVELEGTDDQPYTDAQYAALARVACAVIRAYPAITAGRIAGHCDIAPGRKTDPGPAFDWARFRASIGARPNTPPAS
jgi:AmpD protein